MRRLVALVALGVTPLIAGGVLRAQTPAAAPLPWAYAIAPAPPAPAGGAPAAAAPAPAPDPSMKTLPGSTQSFTIAQIRNMFGPADWFPGDHPMMPDVVAKGRQPDVRACSMCHYPNGK